MLHFSSQVYVMRAVVSHMYRVRVSSSWVEYNIISLGAHVGAACIASPLPLQRRRERQTDRYMLTHTHTRDRQTDRDGEGFLVKWPLECKHTVVGDKIPCRLRDLWLCHHFEPRCQFSLPMQKYEHLSTVCQYRATSTWGTAFLGPQPFNLGAPVVSVWLELQCLRALYANRYTFTSWPLSGYNSLGFLGPHYVGAYYFSQDLYAYFLGFLPYTTSYSPLSSPLPQIPAASADPNSDLCLIHAVRLVSSFWLLFLFCDLRSASRQKARLKWLSCVSLLWGSHLSCLLFNACFKYFVSFIVVYIEKLNLITP